MNWERVKVTWNKTREKFIKDCQKSKRKGGGKYLSVSMFKGVSKIVIMVMEKSLKFTLYHLCYSTVAYKLSLINPNIVKSFWIDLKVK